MYKEMIESVNKNIEINMQRMKELDLIIVRQQAQYDLLIYLQEQHDKKLPEAMGDYKIYKDGVLVEKGTEKLEVVGDGNESQC